MPFGARTDNVPRQSQFIEHWDFFKNVTDISIAYIIFGPTVEPSAHVSRPSFFLDFREHAGILGEL